VWDPKTFDALVIDPVTDYDVPSSKTGGLALEPVIQFIQDTNLKPHLILETHVHADHLSGSQAFKKFFPNIKIVISDQIRVVQRTFGSLFNLGPEFKADGSQFDVL